MNSVCQCRGSALERVQGEPFLVYAPSRTPTIPTVYVRCPRCIYTISLCLWADSRMISLPRTATLGHEFLNKKLIRGSRRMHAVATKSDAVTAWKCTITDAYRRWPTLTGAYGRWFPVRGFCSFRVWPCQTVPQCDWAFRCIWVQGTAWNTKLELSCLCIELWLKNPTPMTA